MTVSASTSFMSANTFAAADATAMIYTVLTRRYTTRYLQNNQGLMSHVLGIVSNGVGPSCVLFEDNSHSKHDDSQDQSIADDCLGM